MMRNIPRKLTLFLAFLMALSLLSTGCANPSVPAAQPTAAAAATPDTTIAPQQEAILAAGTYSAQAQGNNGPVTVEVKCSGSEITEITILSQDETPGIAGPALQTIPSQIVTTQSLAVDALSGATNTSNAILTAVADCIAQAGGDVEEWKSRAIDKAEGQLIEREAQIVILGAGATGMAAAITAAQEGAESILVVEKTADMGGNFIISGGRLNYPDCEVTLRGPSTEGQSLEIEALLEMDFDDEMVQGWQETVRQEYAEHQKNYPEYNFDSLSLAALQDYYNGSCTGAPAATPEGIMRAMQDLNETGDWFTSLGAQWTTPVAIMGFPWPRRVSIEGYKQGQGYYALFQQVIEDNNYPIEIITNTQATEFILDESGKVTGAAAQGVGNGNQYRFTASQAVVLATGGFSANKEMVAQYNEHWTLPADIKTTFRPGTTGDGILMALELGATLTDMSNLMILPMADPISGSMDSYVGTSTGLFVNQEGKRFVNETLSRAELSRAVMEQTDCVFYLISDVNNCRVTDGVTYSGRSLDQLLAEGNVYQADTLEELAQAAGMDPAALTATVDEFNSMIETSEDPAFGRKLFEERLAVKEGPFYASRRTIAVHTTMGGLTIDENYRLLREDGSVIEGLYAGGDVTPTGGIGNAFKDGHNIGKLIMGD